MGHRRRGVDKRRRRQPVAELAELDARLDEASDCVVAADEEAKPWRTRRRSPKGDGGPDRVAPDDGAAQLQALWRSEEKEQWRVGLRSHA